MRCTADLRSREGGQFGLITKKGVASEVVQFPPVLELHWDGNCTTRGSADVTSPPCLSTSF
jgi:hypothetical protein